MEKSDNLVSGLAVFNHDVIGKDFTIEKYVQENGLTSIHLCLTTIPLEQYQHKDSKVNENEKRNKHLFWMDIKLQFAQIVHVQKVLTVIA